MSRPGTVVDKNIKDVQIRTCTDSWTRETLNRYGWYSRVYEEN